MEHRDWNAAGEALEARALECAEALEALEDVVRKLQEDAGDVWDSGRLDAGRSVRLGRVLERVANGVAALDWYRVWLQAESDMFGDTELRVARKCVLAGLPQDAARFVGRWAPEMECVADSVLQYGAYSWITFRVMTEPEFLEFLERDGMTEPEFLERYGYAWRDAAFSGVLVYSE